MFMALCVSVSFYDHTLPNALCQICLDARPFFFGTELLFIPNSHVARNSEFHRVLFIFHSSRSPLRQCALL